MTKEKSNISEIQIEKAPFSYLMSVAFDGTGYRGWQIQPHGATVQSVMEEKLSYLYGSKIIITSSGRTDAGVHALGMAVSFAPPVRPQIPSQVVMKAMNSILPPEIRINSIETKDSNFSARYEAKGKAYTYVIYNSSKINPFSHRWVWQIPDRFDVDSVREASKYLIGTHDFSSFAVEILKTKKDPVRTIYDIKIDRFGDYICITFLGDSFLYKMIRSLMGTLVKIGTGKVSHEKTLEILNAKNRVCAHDTAPAKGLFLVKVFYSYGEWKDFNLTSLPFLCNDSLQQELFLLLLKLELLKFLKACESYLFSPSLI